MNLELLAHAAEQAAPHTEATTNNSNGPLWIVLITFVTVALMALALKLIAASNVKRQPLKKKEE